jgi:hypothetical protein
MGIFIGLLVGLFAPNIAVTLQPLADGFIKLIKMLLAPLIFATVVLGLAKMGNIKEVGRIGVRALLYFEVVSTLALIIGLVVGIVMAVRMSGSGGGRFVAIAGLTVLGAAIGAFTAITFGAQIGEAIELAPRLTKRESSRRRSSFFSIMQVHPGLDLVAFAPAQALLGGLQIGASRIPPAAFGHKTVPDKYLFLARPAAGLKTPLQNLLIGPALQGSLDQR